MAEGNVGNRERSQPAELVFRWKVKAGAERQFFAEIRRRMTLIAAIRIPTPKPATAPEPNNAAGTSPPKTEDVKPAKTDDVKPAKADEVPIEPLVVRLLQPAIGPQPLVWELRIETPLRSIGALLDDLTIPGSKTKRLTDLVDMPGAEPLETDSAIFRVWIEKTPNSDGSP
jgi:hypothetical protein